jgi:putative nucleotide binding protein
MQRQRRRRSERYEEYAYVLDYLPMGNPSDKHPIHRGRPLVQLVGEDYFMLLEATPRRNAVIEVGERVYVGPEERKRVKIAKIDFEIEYEDLTTLAKEMLSQIVEEIVKMKEKVFVEFFNMADAITLRFHSLELLPGVGKRTVMKLVELRSQKPFESYADIKERAKVDPVPLLVQRILSELQGKEKYYLFVRPPRKLFQEPVKPVFLDYLSRIYARIGKVRVEEE